MTRPLLAWVVSAGLVVMAGCGGGGETAPTREAAPSTTTSTSITTSSSSPSSTTTVTTAPAPAADAFASSVRAIDAATAARMTASWRPGCPVAVTDLRLVTLTHWGFDGRVRSGELVVHARYAEAVVSAFERLFAARFAIEQVRLVDEFDGDDDRSMAANNTSAFNCRKATGSDRWSEHAFGRAIDINPVQNPYVMRSGAVLPPNGAAHARRDPSTPGLVTAGGPVVAAFRAIGWGWGGTWSAGKDYQHFSASGR